ncbi:MAG: hypothetical protein AAGU74_04045 [Bacillota bacterium]
MFDKYFKKEPKEPVLLGEDFEIYPDIGPKKTAKPKEEEYQDLPEPELTGLAKTIAELPDDKWVLYQRIAGVLVGVLSGVCLFGFNNTSIGTYGFIGAIVLAVVVPNLFEKHYKRKISVARKWIILTFLVIIVGFLLYTLITSPESFGIGAAAAKG